ncbi:MAG: heavy metal resistance protein CzcO, partial [Saprospiraceae bacterium]
GGENKPKLPDILNLFPKNIYQIHSGDYRNPAQLPAGDVLIIGSATSGVQIAEDLRAANRNVYLSTSAVARVPRRYRGRDIMDWMTDLHFFEKPTAEAEDFALNMKAPLMSGVGEFGHTISLQSLEAKGVNLLGYLKHVNNNTLVFENNLADHIAFGDGFSSQIKEGIEQFISGTQMKALPREQDNDDMPSQAISAREPILELDIIDNNIKTIIWSTGFTSDFSWVNLDVFDEMRKPMHHNGITSVQGLYFMGLPWQRNLKSSLIYGTAGDAEEVTEAVLKYHSEKKELIET